MIPGNLAQRVDLEKLTEDDFKLSGEFRIVPETAGVRKWNIRPEFKPEGEKDYVYFDKLFPEGIFHQCYELIAQTPDSVQIVGAGYLHPSRAGDVCFGIHNGIRGEQSYHNSFPVWFYLLDDATLRESRVQGVVDLIFVKSSPWDCKRDAERQRVLQD